MHGADRIGDPAALSALGITSVIDRPAVGSHMQEHVRVPVAFRTTVPSFNRDARGIRLLREVVEYLRHHKGLLSVTASQVNGFVRSSPEVGRPDLQLVFRPSSGDYVDGRFVIHKYQGVMAMVGLDGVSVHTSRVFGRSAPRRAAGLVRSTKEASRPQRTK